MGIKAIDLTGQKFGKLTVVERASNVGKHTAWLCRCDCGSDGFVVRSDYLKNGHTQSCGCFKSKCSEERLRNIVANNKTHGMSKTRLYSEWQTIKKRCYCPKNIGYDMYGGRGITVCDEWLNDFQAFYDWSMSHGYQDDLTIDRKNVNKGYSPDNCRWVTMEVQGNNKRNNILLTYENKTQTLSQWAREKGLKYSKLRIRIKILKWDTDRALNTP